MMLWLACAGAQVPQALSVDVERYRPPPDPLGYVSTSSAAVLEHRQLALGVHVNTSDDPVVLRDRSGRLVGPGPVFADGVIDRRWRADLVVGLGVRGRFSVGAVLPVTLWQEGFEPSAPGAGSGSIAPVPSGLGDLRIVGKASLRAATEALPLGVAVLGTLSLPTGPSRSFLGEGVPTLAPGLVAEVADSPVQGGAYHVRTAFELALQLEPTDRFQEVAFGPRLDLRWAGAVRPVRALEGGLELTLDVGGVHPAQVPAELLGFVRLFPTEGAVLAVGAGLGVLPGVGAPDSRFFAALVVAPRTDPETVDRDGDGVPNKYDRCPSVPEDLDGVVDLDGCPEDDGDGDGLSDPLDRCPQEPEDVDGYVDSDGCPDPDNDRDGVPDALDRCPDEPEDRDGHQDGDGCPERDAGRMADQDGDGIEDLLDRCPQAPETYNGIEDQDGCPDERVTLRAERIQIRETVFFEVDKAIIQPVSYGLLEEVARLMLAHPELQRVRVEGHTDSEGPEFYNHRLSLARAGAVVQFLVARGVAPDRLEAAGLGETRPIASNRTEEGRFVNRRVEFVIIRR